MPIPKSQMRKQTCLLPVVPKPKLLVPKAHIRKIFQNKARVLNYPVQPVPKTFFATKAKDIMAVTVEGGANVDNTLVAEDTQPVVQIGTQEYDLTAAMAKLQQLLASDEESTDSDGIDSDDI